MLSNQLFIVVLVVFKRQVGGCHQIIQTNQLL